LLLTKTAANNLNSIYFCNIYNIIKGERKEVRRGIKKKEEVWKEMKSAVTANNINTRR